MNNADTTAAPTVLIGELVRSMRLAVPAGIVLVLAIIGALHVELAAFLRHAVVAFGLVLLLAACSTRYSSGEDGYLRYLGFALPWAGLFDLALAFAHTHPGEAHPAALIASLEAAIRLVQGGVLAAAAWWAGRKAKPAVATLPWGVAAAALMAVAIAYPGRLAHAFELELAAALLVVVAAVGLALRREAFEPETFRLLVAALGFFGAAQVLPADPSQSGIAVELPRIFGVWLLYLATVRALVALPAGSESTYRRMFETSAVGVSLAAADGALLTANAAFARMLGYPDSASLNAARPSLRALYGAGLLERVAREGSAGAVELEVQKVDGGTTWLSGSLVTVRSRSGQVLGFQGSFHDVTAAREAQARLREEQARFRSLTALSSDWYWEQDPHLRFREVKDALSRHLGLAAEGYVGKTRWELAGASLKDPRWADHAGRLERREVFVDFEYERSPGLWVSVSGEPVFDPGGRFLGYRGVGRDITARKQHERALRRLGRLYAALSALNEAIPRARDADGLLQRACDIAAGSGEFLRATVRMREAGSHRMRVVATSGVHGDVVARHLVSVDPALPEGRTLVAEAIRTGQPVIVTDLDNDPRLAHIRGSPLFAGSRSVGVYPLRQGTEMRAALILHGSDARSFEGEMGTLLERMAANISFGLEHLETELRLRQTFERAGTGIAHVGLDGRLLRVNPALCKLLGYAEDELVGRSVKDISHAEDRDLTDEERARLHRGDPVSLRFEKRYLRKDGAPVWTSLTIALARDSAGHPAYEISFLEDITQRKRAEAEREKVRRMYASLGAVNELVSRARDDQELLQGACEIAVSSGDFQIALVRVADTEAGLGAMAAYAGPERMAWLERPLSLDPGSPDAASIALRAWRRAKPVMTTVGGNEDASLFARQSFAAGTRSSGAFPLFRGGICIGALLLNSREPDGFDSETQRLLVRMAEAVSRGLYRVAADEALQRFRVAMDASADMIVLVDCETLRIVDVNERLCRLIGYSREELLAMHAQDVVPLPRAELAADYRAMVEEPSQPGVLRSRYLCKDGSTIPFESTRHVVRSGGRWLMVAVSRDTRERDAAEAERAALIERNHGLVEALGEIIYDWRPLEDRLIWEGDYPRILGYTPGEIGADTESWTSRVHPDDLPAVLAELEVAKRERRRYHLEYRFRHQNGRYLWMHDRGVLFLDEGGELHRVLGVLVDVNARRQAENALLGIVQATATPLLLVDTEGRTVFANPAASALFGRPVSEMEGAPLGLPLADARPAQVDILRPDGSARPAEMQFVSTELGGRAVMVVSLHDLSERKRYEEHIEHLANHDALTGLPNRTLLRDRVEQAIVHAQRTEGHVALMFVDLDQFKFVNDSWGHGAGDALLLEVGRRLNETMRSGDTVARLGGDEFVVLLCDLSRSGDAAVVAEKVAEALSRPLELEGRTLQVTASIGISMFPGDGTNLDSLLQCADAAMYRAKEAGRNGYQYYSAEMGAQARLRVETEAGLRRAMDRHELLLHYQPQVWLAGGEVRGFEALMRWRHPQRGMVSPAEFIPVAEDSGLIMPMGQMALHAACRQAARWSADGLGALRVAVNLSARQFWRGSVADVVRHALAESGLPPAQLEVEITESVVARDLQQVMRTLRELREMGISVAIDDFGTGYSSLAYLRSLPIDKLKIDRSFIHGIPSDPEATALVGEIIRLAHVLSLEVVAEGVETLEQARFLREAGCEAMQGYYFSKPLDQADCSALLRAGRRLAL